MHPLFQLFLLALMLYSCSPAQEEKALVLPGTVQGDPKSANWDDWKAWPPLDTSALLHSLGLVDSNAVAWFADTSSGIEWQSRMDTMEVVATMPACTCPDHEVVDTAHFGIDAVYAQPMVNSVVIPERAYVAGNRFVLIGQRSAETYKPEPTMGPPWPGYHFRYHAYQIVKPFRVWGPLIPNLDADTMGIDEEPLWIGTVLEVE